MFVPKKPPVGPPVTLPRSLPELLMFSSTWPLQLSSMLLQTSALPVGALHTSAGGIAAWLHCWVPMHTPIPEPQEAPTPKGAGPTVQVDWVQVKLLPSQSWSTL